MLGMYKPSKRANYKSVAINSDGNVTFSHYLKDDAAFIATFTANNQTYYHLEGEHKSITEISEAPIYTQTLT